MGTHLRFQVPRSSLGTRECPIAVALNWVREGHPGFRGGSPVAPNQRESLST